VKAIRLNRRFMNGYDQEGKLEWGIGFYRPAISAMFGGLRELPRNDSSFRLVGHVFMGAGGRILVTGDAVAQGRALPAAPTIPGMVHAFTGRITRSNYSGQRHDPKPRGEDATVAALVVGSENMRYLDQELITAPECFDEDQVTLGNGTVAFSSRFGLVSAHEGKVVMYNPSRLPALLQELVARGFDVSTLNIRSKKALVVTDAS